MGQSIEELTADLKLTTQILKNVHTSNGKEILAKDEVQKVIKECEEKIANKGRILLRPSGTEPKIRIMAEGDDETLLNSVVNHLIDVIQQEGKNYA